MKWEMVKLGDVTNNLDNRRIPLNGIERSKIEVSGLYPYIGANNIITYIDKYIFDEEILCVAEDGGSWGANEKCSFIVNEKCWVNNHAHVLTTKPNINIHFLMNYLNWADLSKYITGTTRGKLTKSALNSILIPLPPLAEQARIAAVLDAADQLRRADRALRSKYDALTQAVFYEMFGDPVKNEKGWEVRKLGEVGKNFKYGTNAKSSEENKSGAIPVLRIPNIAFGSIDTSELKYSVVPIEEIKGLLLQRGDLLFVRSNGNPDYIGRCASFQENYSAIFASYLIRVQLQPEHISSSSFISFIMNFPTYRHIITREAQTTAGNYNLNTQSLKSLPLISPPLALQQSFAARVQAIESQKALAAEALERSEALMGSLMAEVFGSSKPS